MRRELLVVVGIAILTTTAIAGATVVVDKHMSASEKSDATELSNVNLTLQNATATIKWTDGTGTVLNSTTVSSTNNYSLSWQKTSASTVASDELVVGSQHDSFGTSGVENSPQTLTNLTVEGSGDSASVTLSGGALVDSYEDNDLAEYGHGTSNYNIVSQNATDGSYSVKGTASSGTFNYLTSTSGLTDYPSAGDTFSADVTLGSDSVFAGFLWAVQGNTNTPPRYEARIEAGTDELRFLSWDGSTTTFDKTVALDQAVAAGDTLTIRVNWQSDGTMNVTVLTQSGTVIGQASATDTTYSSGGIGWLTTDGSIYGDNIRIGSSGNSATYLSAVHNVTNGEQAAINVTTASNVSVDAIVQTASGTTLNSTTFTSPGNHTVSIPSYSGDKLETRLKITATGSNPAFALGDESILWNSRPPEVDGGAATPQNDTDFDTADVELSVPISDPDFSTAQNDSVTVDIYVDGSVVDTQTISSNQTVSTVAQNLGDGAHTWHVEAVDEYGENVTSSTWTFEVKHYAPTVDNASATPQDNAKLDAREVTLSVPLNDTDFADSTGDNVTVKTYVDGSVVDTQTVMSNQTVSTNVSVTGGTHTWYMSMTDSYNLTTNSSKIDFATPSKLIVRNETAPNDKINNSVTIEITFFGDEGTVETRTSKNGTINMTGLPVDESFVATATADKYESRTVVIESLIDQQNLFLLPKTANSVDVEYKIDDQTGQFAGDQDTQLLIQKAITLNNNTEYRTIVGDYLSSTGTVAATLQRDQRYRLVVRSGSQERRLGSYVAQNGGTQIVPVGRVNVSAKSEAGYVFATETLTAKSGSDYLRVVYKDSAEQTTHITYDIYKIDIANGTETLVASRTVDQTVGTYSELINISTVDGRYRVSADITRDGQVITLNRTAGQVPDIATGLALDDKWAALAGLVFVVAVAGWTTVYEPDLAAVATVVAAGFVAGIGLTPIPNWALGPAAAAAVFFAVGRGNP